MPVVEKSDISLSFINRLGKSCLLEHTAFLFRFFEFSWSWANLSRTLYCWDEQQQQVHRTEITFSSSRLNHNKLLRNHSDVTRRSDKCNVNKPRDIPFVFGELQNRKISIQYLLLLILKWARIFIASLIRTKKIQEYKMPVGSRGYGSGGGYTPTYSPSYFSLYSPTNYSSYR